MKKSAFYMIILLLFCGPMLGMAYGQVSFIASARQEVRVGEQFEIVYQVNAKADNFTPPDFKGLMVLSGPNTSSSSSVQFINGKMSQSYALTYSFIMMANQAGDINCAPATVKVNGKKYISNSLHIRVSKNKSTSSVRSGPGSAGANMSRANNSQISSDKRDVFIKATVNNKSPFLGQQVVLTYQIYTRVPVSNLSINKVSSFKGLWSQDLLADRAALQQHNEQINGQQYVVATIRKLALIPQQTGKLTVDPMELECNVQLKVKQKQRRSSNDPFDDFFNDPFFNQNVRNVKKTLVSNPVEIHVKALPVKGKPASFAGAVGQLSFKSSVDKTSLSTNDALTLSISISGAGNIELIDAPSVTFPSDFETYDPKITSKLNKTEHGVSGSKNFEYLAIPRNPGDFTIKPVSFSFFNPRDGRYHTFHSDTLHVHVVKGKGGGSISYTGNAQEGIHLLGKDIRHIKEGPYGFTNAADFLFGSSLYIGLMLLPIVLLILTFIMWRFLKNRRANISLLKNRKANKVARQRLVKAQKMKKQTNDKGFYDEIAQALWGYITDKFAMQSSELSMDTVKEMLLQQQVSEETIKGFLDILNNIEFARFAPGDAKGKMENIYSEALQAIMQAEKSLK